MNFFLEKIRNKLGNNLLHEMQMMGVSTVVSSLLSMFSVKCFGSITSDFRKYFESRKYYDIFVIISQIQTIPNFGNHSELSESLGNFRNHSEISEFFYTWRAIRLLTHKNGDFRSVLIKQPPTFRNATHHWFPREMTSEKREQKFHTNEASLHVSG